jgi:tetratricopeptide (TPR) repeat protein
MRALIALALFVLAAGAAGQPQFVYVPSDDIAQVQASARALGQQVGAGKVKFFVLKGPLSAMSARTYVDWSWDDEQGMSFRMLTGSETPPRIEYQSVPKPGVISDTVLGASFYGVPLNEEWVLWADPFNSDHKLALAKWLADMIALRRNLVLGRAAFEAKFQETLAKYPTPGSRPPLTEEARRFKIQAEAAVERKDFAQALNAYGLAVGEAPWWSEGFFNTALLFAEQKNYRGAIRNMKRFLLLEPSHPKARDAQDQIYRWEALAK